METSMSLSDKKYVEKLKESYSEKGISKLDELRALDKKAKQGAEIFAFSFGVIGSLVLGLGMCIAMQIILSDLMFVGVIIGLVGILMVVINYLIYKKLLKNGKNKYQNRILSLSNDLLNEIN